MTPIKAGLIRRIILGTTIGLVGILLFSMQNPDSPKTKITIKPNQSVLITEAIQKAIDSCASTGGGVVIFPAGRFVTGGIELKSKVTLQLEKGALLQGSDKYSDYKNDAFIFGKGLSDIAIVGEGVIDGVDCYNPNGEEGFRGPHCIRLIDCKNIAFKGITIKNSANWAINCRHCSFGTVENVTILAGHDGLHTRFCDNFTVSRCDFRTGDDAFAGNDNKDFVISDCKINTSCNGFRMGCLNLTVQRCKFWGPGQFIHKIQKRNNMLSAFVHFSPKDEKPGMKSGNWIIKDITVDNVDHFYNYNFQNGLWQTGQPVTDLRFDNIKATNVLSAFNIVGDSNLKLDVKNSQFSFREGSDYKAESFEGAKIASRALFNAVNFNEIKLQNVTLEKKGTTPLLESKSGNTLMLQQVNFVNGGNSNPYIVENVERVKEIK